MSNSDSQRNTDGNPLEALEETPTAQAGRRDFLKVAGLTLASVSLPDFLASCDSSVTAAGEKTASTAAAVTSSLDYTVNASNWVDVVRPADMLRLRFNFVQLTQVTDHTSPSKLSLQAGATPGLILVEFPPQHIVEPTVQEPLSGPPTSVPGLPIDARISGKSQLAFVVPAGTSVPYDLEALLTGITKLDLNVPQNALPASDDTLIPVNNSTQQTTTTDGAIAFFKQNAQTSGANDISSDVAPAVDPVVVTPPPVAAPAESQTAIELPYRLVLSPNSDVRFGHAAAPVQGPTGLTELWTSRLARKGAGDFADETTRFPVSVRAVYSPDLTSPQDPFGMNTVLVGANRVDLVNQTSNFSSSPTYPIHARHLALSARGGSLDTFAEFGNLPLKNWQQRTHYGRDNYIRVEISGFLFPWWHRATVVFIGERKFLANPGGGLGPRTAFVWERNFIIIRQPVVDYRTIFFARDWAFQSIHILTPSTPPLDKIDNPPTVFWPTIGGSAFRFAAQFVDLEGNITKSNLAAVWVPDPFTAGDLSSALTMFENDSDPTSGIGMAPRNVSDFQRQGIAYAPTSASANAPSTIGKTTFETGPVTWDARLADVIGMGSSSSSSSGSSSSSSGTTIFARTVPAAFHPYIKKTQVSVPSLRQFTGTDTLIPMSYPDAYKNNGFPDTNPGNTNNQGEVFLALDSVRATDAGGADFGSQSQRGGGFMAPNLNIVGLSRQIGPVSGVPQSGGDVSTQIGNFASSGGIDASLLLGNIVGSVLGQAMLFGCFKLSDLFGGVGKILPPTSLPKFATETLDVIGTVLRTFQQIQDTANQLNDLIGTIPTGLQSGGQTLPALPSAFTDIQSQISKVGSDFQAFASAITSLPSPPTPANIKTFVDNAQSKLSALLTDTQTLSGSVSSARSLTTGLATAQQLADSAFAKADSLLRSGLGLLASAGQATGDLATALNAIATLQDAAANMTSRLEWSTGQNDIKPIDFLFPQVFFPNQSNDKYTRLKITAEVRAHEVAGKPAGLDLTATLNDFDINLLGAGDQATPNNPSTTAPSGSISFISISFDHLTFSSMAGQMPAIDVGFSAITFEGDLAFLNALKSIIPLGGFSDPPGITVDASGITGDFSLALPNLGVGVFALENLSLAATFNIPFIGEPMTFGFHFCERQSPFHLTVSFLSGGGYFIMDLSMRGVVNIEAAIEFGAEASVDLVVASGSVLVMAGIYFNYTPAGVKLAGYVRLAGSLSVLGLITASIEMRLTLGYQGPPSQAYGTATISIEISILFFSASVDITCTKTFGAQNSDPTFTDVYGTTPGTDWNDYVLAFAA